MTAENKSAVTGEKTVSRAEQQVRDGATGETVYDYTLQCWIVAGKVAACGHKEKTAGCYACAHSADLVNMPPRETFAIVPEYYNTLFHELGHSTGHESRLDRLQKRQSNFGDTSYAREELIAEMTASFLCGQAGIERDTIDNSASYIANWLERLKNDRKLVVQAASAGNKAADYILGKLPATVAVEGEAQ